MIRKMIVIDEDKCNGCGLCVNACHESALVIENQKAKLIRDDYCDGLGDCLPVCPMNAISFIEREAVPYNPDKHRKEPIVSTKSDNAVIAGKDLQNKILNPFQNNSQLVHWPLKLKLISVNTDFLRNADLLIAADCSAFAYDNFHSEFIQGRTTLITCPKLDSEDYSEKLAEIIKYNAVQNILIVKMSVPCCSAIERMVKRAIELSEMDVQLIVKTISLDGKII